MPVDARGASHTNWVCSALAIIILLTRAVLSRGTIHITLVSKCICIISLLVITLRLPIVYILMLYNSEDRQNLNNEELKKAAVLTLSARVLATVYFWLQVALLLRFYTRIIGHIWWARRAITATWIFFFATLATVILITIFECHPLHLYWASNGPRCQQAQAQIFAQGIFNIILDLALLGIVLPVIARARLARHQKFQIFALLLLGTMCIIVTGLKLKYVVGSNSAQAMRTFWASIQIVVSTFVANMPTIIGCAGLKRPWQMFRLRRMSADQQDASLVMDVLGNQKQAGEVDSEIVEDVSAPASYGNDEKPLKASSTKT